MADYPKYHKYYKKNKLFDQFGSGINENYKQHDLLTNIKNFNIATLCKNKKIFDISKINSIEFDNNNIVINGDKFVFSNRIGSGTYGTVDAYKNDSDEYIAIKKGITSYALDDDIEILNYMKEHNICSNIYVKSKIINYGHPKKIILMEFMDGTVSNLIGVKLPFHSIITIFKQIVKSIYCIGKHKLLYTDIKPANLLYRCNSDGTINIILGDIGSIYNANIAAADFEAVATFPPINKTTPSKKGLFTSVNDKDVVWSLGILFLLFFNIDSMKYSFSKILLNHAHISSDIETVRKELLEKNTERFIQIRINNLMYIIKNALSPTEENRLSLEDLYHQIFTL